ncbi:MAG TPA: hypothetical protein VF383_12730, partial [Candidatus Dormibacteraeota bacterium]
SPSLSLVLVVAGDRTTLNVGRRWRPWRSNSPSLSLVLVVAGDRTTLNIGRRWRPWRLLGFPLISAKRHQ